MKRTAVIDVVGLTGSLIGADTPRLAALARAGTLRPIRPAFPAVTCTAQANYVTGRAPAGHGIVGNGWYDRTLAEVQFWKQSNRLVGAPKLWERLRALDPAFTCAKLFWWYNMYARVDFSATPRPMYPADGRKVFDIYTGPATLRTELTRALGPFPFPCFWGPAAGKTSPAGGPDAVSRWIAAAARLVEERHAPTLHLVYLPHLDYNLQRHGVWEAAPAAGGNATTPRRLKEIIRPDLRAIDTIVGELIDFLRGRGVQVVVLSEYGLTNVVRAVHLNRRLRERGLLAVREELGRELLDPGASRAFAVADHQVAHVYVNDPACIAEVRRLLEREPGVAAVLGRDEQIARGLAHARAGDLVAVADEDAWFTYYYWLEDRRAPDFARTVDIHRKPGYDPVELFLDPGMALPKARIAWRLLQKRLGFRMLMDVIPLEAELVRGSHGAVPRDPSDWPVLLLDQPDESLPAVIESTAVHDLLGARVAPGVFTAGAGDEPADPRG